MPKLQKPRPFAGIKAGVVSRRVVDTTVAEPAAVLVEKMADGDHTAAARLHAAFHADLLRVAQSMLRDAADAEEVVSDTFAKAWRESAHFDGARGSVAAWLIMMVRSRSRDVARARRRRERTHDRAEAQSAIDSAAVTMGWSTTWDVAREVESQELRRLLWRALWALPAVQRDAIELVFLQSVPHARAADQLGIPLGTVKTRVRNGLRQMRAVLERAGVTLQA